jgi:hypothetical protein
MSLPFARGLACLLGAVFCFASFFVWGEWSNGYLERYGSFVPSFGELALRLHLLLFVLPGTLLLAVGAADLSPAPRRLLAWFDAVGRVRPARWWPSLLALLVLGVTAGIRWVVLEELPITDDEHVYMFQARLLESGRLYADSLPTAVRPFFDNQFIVNNGRWFGCYFLGHPAMLALALKIGLGQWLGPIEAALTFLLTVGIARRIGGERVAIISGALLVASPFFLFLAATQLSQPTSALMLSLFWYAALRIEAGPRSVRWWALAAGALSFGVLTRPQTTVVLALPFVVRLAFLAMRGRLRPGAGSPAVAVGILAVGAAVLLAINQALTGSPWRTGYHAYMAQGINWLFPFGPFYSVREISRNLGHLNFWLFGWPVSLAFLPFFRREGAAWALAMVPALAVVWYGIVAVPTVATVGPVYFGEAIGALVILSAGGIERVITVARARLGDSVWPQALIAWPVVGSLACVLTFLPVQVSSLLLSSELVKAPYDLVERQRLDNAIVFVHSLPSHVKAPGSWVGYHRNNSPDLTDRVLFVRDLGPEKNKDLMRYLPSRAPYAMGMRGSDLVLVPVAPPQ